MKKLILVFLALVSLMAAIIGCTNNRSPENAEFKIKVTGTEGTKLDERKAGTLVRPSLGKLRDWMEVPA